MRYHGFATDPFEYAVRPVAPPFAPSAFARPAPDPEEVQAPKRLAGPIFFAPGWHVGPAVSATGYGAAEGEEKGMWASLSTGTKVGLAVTGVLALGAIAAAFGAFTKPKKRKNPAKRKNTGGKVDYDALVYDYYHGPNAKFYGLTFNQAVDILADEVGQPRAIAILKAKKPDERGHVAVWGPTLQRNPAKRKNRRNGRRKSR